MGAKSFKEFILRGNAVELAIGVVIGAAFNNVVNAFVKDLLTPLIGVIFGKADFAKWYFTIRGSQFTYGDLLNQIISLLIIGLVIYYLVITPINKISTRLHLKKQQQPTTKKCPMCMSDIPIDAKRCPQCTTIFS